MRRAIAIFLALIYTGFVAGNVWSAPVSAHFAIEKSAHDSNKEINDPEPLKDFEAPNFSNVVKNLPVKIKLPRAQGVLVQLKKPVRELAFITGTQKPLARNIILHDTPLFIKNNVFRI